MSTLSTTNLKNPNAVGNNIILNADGSSSLNSPVLTGVPTAPTAANGTKTTQIATTAFVLANAGGGITIGTPKASTSGPTIDFTGIPSGVKRITMIVDGVSTTGGGNGEIRFRLGTSSGIVTTGYNGSVTRFGSSGAAATVSTTSFLYTGNNSNSSIWYGTAVFVLAGTNVWAVHGAVISTSSAVANCVNAGTITLADELDRIQLSIAGSDTFDAGTVNITYE